MTRPTPPAVPSASASATASSPASSPEAAPDASPDATPPAWRSGAVDLAAAYRQGDRSPVDVLASCLARIDAVDPRLNAFVAQRRDAARVDAVRSAERHAAGTPLSPLDGIPIAVKDNIPSADLPTTWGCRSMRDYRPDHDERVLARARAAGAIIIGKTNASEFTLEGYTSNRLFGTTRNPWNPLLTPGGSSGGSVAAVAAGMVPLAFGTDGGGSTRRPASHTGLVGLKPSIGAIARTHALPPLLLDFEVVGPIARCVADLRLLFDAVRGPHPDDRSSRAVGAATSPRRADAPAASRPLRVLYVPTLAAAPVDPVVAASCRTAVERLTAIGCDVTTGDLPLDLAFLEQGWPMIGRVGLASLFARHPAWRSDASDLFIEMADAGAAVPAPALWTLLEAVAQLRRDCDRLFQRIDLIVTPSAAALPWPADSPWPPVIAGQPVGPRGHAIFTGWVNAAGLPAIAMPCRPAADGLPIGVQLIGAYGTDDALLDVADAFERTAPMAWQWPTLE